MEDHLADVSYYDPLEAEAVGWPGRGQAGLQGSQKMKETRVHLPYVTLIIQKPSQLCVDSNTKGIEFIMNLVGKGKLG